MKIFILFTLLIFGSCTETVIQGNGNIRGILINTQDNTPIENLSLCVQGVVNKCDTTSAEGYFDLTQLQIGNYTLINSDDDYDSQKISITLDKNLEERKTYYIAKDDFTEDKMVITVSWDKDVDLDSHLVIPLNNATDCNTTDGNSIQTTTNDKTTIIDFENGLDSIYPF